MLAGIAGDLVRSLRRDVTTDWVSCEDAVCEATQLYQALARQARRLPAGCRAQGDTTRVHPEGDLRGGVASWEGGLTRWPAIVGAVRSPNREALDAMIAAATVDYYNDSECVTGFYTMLDEHLAMPFQTCVLGVDVTVTGVDLADDDQSWRSALVAGGGSASRSWICRCRRLRLRAGSGSRHTVTG
jgi:hypothetical protein